MKMTVMVRSVLGHTGHRMLLRQWNPIDVPQSPSAALSTGRRVRSRCPHAVTARGAVRDCGSPMGAVAEVRFRRCTECESISR